MLLILRNQYHRCPLCRFQYQKGLTITNTSQSADNVVIATKRDMKFVNKISLLALTHQYHPNNGLRKFYYSDIFTV